MGATETPDLREGRHDGLIDAFFEHSYVIVSVDDAQVETLAGAHDVIVDWATTGTIEEKEELRYPGLKPTGWVRCPLTHRSLRE